ncbi:putative alpha beta hydrolase fold-3 domain protein [Phaeomoniella chlamydospora]|uniref:Putative alpha beta hydrolase fold-3 domain protein n=1 Tax=Phaeomoniella chlamydospora TaxID=158046 RepID=A0A0G2GHZ9_PHACM|nr:putative alpha beta hydrolase fold-3 domain protein [Phaeomoniella chlamydospora]
MATTPDQSSTSPPEYDTQPIREVLSKFTQLTTSYKTVGGHEIAALVFVPENVQAVDNVPVIASFHGGGLVIGSAKFLEWHAAWLFHWALSHSAVIVMPNYRLLPESNGRDILFDVSDLWTWIATSLQAYIEQELPDSKLEINPQKVIAHGNSAGGYLALLSGFMIQSMPSSLNIRGIVACYPMIDLEDPWYTEADHRTSEKFIGMPFVPGSVIEAHAAHVRSNPQPPSPVSDRSKLEDLGLMISLFHSGRLPEFLQGPDPEFPAECYPLRRLQPFSGSRFPPTLILHGLQDSTVQAEDSRR